MFTKLCRICRDVVLRQTPSGKSVCNLAVVYDVGWGENKKPQFLEFALFDKRAETLAPMLEKGQQIVVTLDDIYVDAYVNKEGVSTPKLTGRVIDVALVARSTAQPQAARTPTKPSEAQGSMPNFEDDIPFSPYESNMY
jgi:single-strand DNA-binding protein